MHAPRSPSYALLLFHSAVAVLFCMTKQIKERKGRDTDQICSTFRIVDAKIIGGFRYHDGGRSLIRSTLRWRSHPGWGHPPDTLLQ